MKRTAALLCLLAGCAGPQVWNKPGATPEQFRVDQGQCEAQSLVVPGGAARTQMAFEACMRGKGYYEER